MKTVFDYEQEGRIQPMKKCCLLSASPRRQALLDFLHPEIASSVIDERRIEEEYLAVYAADPFLHRAAKTCCEIAKAKSAIPLEAETLYISADTMVIVDEEIYNKPRDFQEAERMFRSYFGRSHHVVTAVCLRMRDYLDVFYALAEIRFVPYYPALEEPIQAYLRSGTMMDKAGAYGISDLDPRFVAGINGDWHTIIGFPVAEAAKRILAE